MSLLWKMSPNITSSLRGLDRRGKGLLLPSNGLLITNHVHKAVGPVLSTASGPPSFSPAPSAPDSWPLGSGSRHLDPESGPGAPQYSRVSATAKKQNDAENTLCPSQMSWALALIFQNSLSSTALWMSHHPRGWLRFEKIPFWPLHSREALGVCHVDAEQTRGSLGWLSMCSANTSLWIQPSVQLYKMQPSSPGDLLS